MLKKFQKFKKNLAPLISTSGHLLTEKFLQHQINDESEIPATNELSDKMSKDMKKRGFKFTGSTVIYAFLQAVGVINDHADYCYRQAELMD